MHTKHEPMMWVVVDSGTATDSVVCLLAYLGIDLILGSGFTSSYTPPCIFLNSIQGTFSGHWSLHLLQHWWITLLRFSVQYLGFLVNTRWNNLDAAELMQYDVDVTLTFIAFLFKKSWRTTMLYLRFSSFFLS